MKPNRIHFSCGAASATSLLIAAEQGDFYDAWYADTGGEHPDNMRFLQDIEQFAGIKINIVKSDKYTSHFDVWEKTRFIKGQNGATCTSRLKRETYLKEAIDMDYCHVFGFTKGEELRLEKRQNANPHLQLRSLLIERGMTKYDCLEFLAVRKIIIPKMYRLGFNNANCIGCCHGGKGYWNKIKKHFPEQFERAAKIQRELGEGSAFWQNADGTRKFLDELKPNEGRSERGILEECGLFCANGGL